MAESFLEKLKLITESGKNISILLFGELIQTNTIDGKIIKVEKDYLVLERRKTIPSRTITSLIIPIDKIIAIQTSE